MPQTTLTESATCTTCVLHVARISNVESVLFGIREDLEDNSLEKCLMGFACNRDINLLFYFDLICFSWWGNTLQWKKSQKNTKTQSTTAQIYTYWDWQKKMSSFDSKKNDISPSCWWDYSYDVECYWSWVESTGKDHVQSVFEKGVPASILVWTLTLSVNRAWLWVRSG